MSEPLFLSGGGELGSAGGMIEIVWAPDPRIIAAKILELAAYLENFIPPLEASRGIAQRDMQEHFDTESGPNGEAWAPLADSTIERWGEHPILQLTGAMRDAATSEGAYVIDGRDLFIDTSSFPPYWVFHETGTSGKGMGQILEELKAKGFEIDPLAGGGMPARPFVGISFEAQMLIIEAFDAWFEGGVAGFYTRPSGKVQRILRTPEGGTSFGPMLGGG
jgi:hypothetical protein